MPTIDGRVRITRTLIERGCTGRGGWNKDQLTILGIEWPPPKHWKLDLVMNERYITQEESRRFVELKGVSNKERRKMSKKIDIVEVKRVESVGRVESGQPPAQPKNAHVCEKCGKSARMGYKYCRPCVRSET